MCFGGCLHKARFAGISLDWDFIVLWEITLGIVSVWCILFFRWAR